MDVKTSLGVATESVYSDKLVLTTILRAGIPFHQGFLSIFDHISLDHSKKQIKHFHMKNSVLLSLSGTSHLRISTVNCESLLEYSIIPGWAIGETGKKQLKHWLCAKLTISDKLKSLWFTRHLYRVKERSSAQM